LVPKLKLGPTYEWTSDHVRRPEYVVRRPEL
jgi:hypothetical protein